MDLCGPMRIQSINGREYMLVIVDDYSRFTWVKFLRSKDEVQKFMIKFLKMIQVRLNATIRNIKTDNGTEFVNQTLSVYYEEALLFLWAEAVAIACYIQNRSLIRKVTTKHPMNFSMIENLTYPIYMSLVLSAISLMTVRTLYLNPPPCVDRQVPAVIALEHTVSTGKPSSTTIDQDAPSTSTSQTNQETPSPIIPLGVEKADHDIEVALIDNNPYLDFPIPEPSSKESSSRITVDNVIGDPSRSVSTRNQLQDEAIFCYFDAFLSSVEPKSYKEALTESYWIEAMQEELNEFERLEV
ncbi:retrovirus-related pol polyprotein from transposon TNT 1-94 [Tanacetum coccineum]